MNIGKIMGITGGVIGLLFGLFLLGAAILSSSYGGLTGDSAIVAKSYIIGILAVGIPILSIVGGGMVSTNPKAAAICMSVSAIFFVFLGFSAGNFLIFLPGLLMCVGAATIVLELRKSSADQS